MPMSIKIDYREVSVKRSRGGGLPALDELLLQPCGDLRLVGIGIAKGDMAVDVLHLQDQRGRRREVTDEVAVGDEDWIGRCGVGRQEIERGRCRGRMTAAAVRVQDRKHILFEHLARGARLRVGSWVGGRSTRVLTFGDTSTREHETDQQNFHGRTSCKRRASVCCNDHATFRWGLGESPPLVGTRDRKPTSLWPSD